MQHVTSSGIAAALLALGLCAMSGPSRAAETVREGTLEITGTLTIDPSIPLSATISVSIGASAGNCYVSASPQLVRQGATGIVEVTLSYQWPASNCSAPTSVSFSAQSGVHSAGASEPFALPANGATTKIAISLGL